MTITTSENKLERNPRNIRPLSEDKHPHSRHWFRYLIHIRGYLSLFRRTNPHLQHIELCRPFKTSFPTLGTSQLLFLADWLRLVGYLVAFVPSMADDHIQIMVGEPGIPLLNNQESNPEQNEGVNEETILDKTLQRLHLYLSFLGFNQSCVLNFIVSWAGFVSIGVVLPVVILELSNCPGCEKGQIKSFEIGMVASQACLAAASLMCLSHNLRKHGIRKFLFVDRYSGHVHKFSALYVRKISESVRLVVLWVLLCSFLKTVREIIRIMYVHHESWWQSAIVSFAFVFSWMYVTTIILTACIVFHVVCNLQIFHFEDYGKLLGRESDVIGLLQEHARLRYYLSKISHRFRIYLLLQFLLVTISQFVILFQTTGHNGVITLINGGDFAVTSVVQVVSIILCLNAAAKISHRAQGVGAVATRWHALITCSAADRSLSRTSSSTTSLDTANRVVFSDMENSESDLESLDFMTAPTNTQLASYMSSYHKRLALVMYLQSNPGGITVFGWTIDRGMINTIFFLELTLVTFVLGVTIVA